MYHKILVPIDGSKTAMAGLEEAVKLAKVHHGRIRVFHVVNEFILDYSYAAGMYASNLIASLRESGERILRQAEAFVREHGIEVDGVLQESIGGPAAELIMTQAQQWRPDLIVMGTHGRRGLRRLALGSDAESVVREATMPVLLVHGPAETGAAAPQAAKDPAAKAGAG